MQAKLFKQIINPHIKQVNKQHPQLASNPQSRTIQKKFNYIEKFNPNYGKDGRFTNSDSAASFTYKPGESKGFIGYDALNEYAVVDSKQATIKKSIYSGGDNLNDEINKADKEKYALYIGLNVTGAEHLAIDGGEDPKDFHVTLLYGYYQPQSDVEDTAVRIQSAREEAVKYLPETLKLDKIDRFEASESSDGKDVIYARVAPGQLEKAHNILLKKLNERGLKVQTTFEEYNPHMTLAYIDPDEEVELKDIDETVTIKNLTEGFETDEASSKENQSTFNIAKTDDDKRLVFGWALVAKDKDGNVIKDHQNDMIDEDDLEEGAYEYVLNFRDAGEEHIPGLRKKARMVESCVFTEEKQKALGIPEGIVPTGWWIGFYVDDDNAWEKIKDGTYKMFSIEGKAIRVPVDEVQHTDDLAKSFSDVVKYNKWHGKDGRFTSGPSASSGTSSASQITYEYDEKAGVDYGNFPDEQQAAVSRWTFSAEGIRNPKTEQEKKDAKALENYIKEGKNDITEKIYRGIVMSNEDYNAMASAVLSLENIDQKGLSSWSSDKSLASSFGGIHGGKGTEREGVRSVVFIADGFKKGSARYLPSHYGEDEVLVSANTKLKITKIKYDRDINATFVHVQDVAKSDNVAKSFAEILKFNPYHGKDGRFTSASGANSFSASRWQMTGYDDKKTAFEQRGAAAGAASGDSMAEAKRAIEDIEANKKRIHKAESTLKSMLKDGAEVKLSGVDPELAESTVSSVQMVLKKYPSVKNAFGGFTTDEPEEGYFTNRQGTYACYSPNTGKIHLNIARYSNKAEFEKRYNEGVKEKHFPEGTTAKSSVVHEMGHAIDRYVSLQTIDPWKVNWGETVSTRIRNTDIRAAKKKGEPLTGKIIKEGLSGYACKDAHEYFAEAFSESMTSPNPRKMASSIVKRMETYIKKAEKSVAEYGEVKI